MTSVFRARGVSVSFGGVRAEGSVELAGTSLDGLAPHVRAQRGLARTWDTRQREQREKSDDGRQR